MEEKELEVKPEGEEEVKESEPEAKEEPKVEEAPAPEVEPEPEPVEENFEYEGSLKNIEQDRIAFLTYYRRTNTFKWVVAILALALVIFAWIGLGNILKDNKNVMLFQIIGVVVPLIGIVTYTLLTKNAINKRMRKYFRDFYKNTSEYAFDQEGFSNIERPQPDKLPIDEFCQCDLYKDVVEVGSRGYMTFEYHNIPMVVSDAAAQIKGTNRLMPVFVGKFIYGKADYHNEEPIFIYIKGSNKPLPPTNIEGKKAVFDDDKMVIWSNNKDWKKVITPAFKKLLGELKLNKVLIDVAVSIKEGQIFVLLGYDDPLMVLPLENPYNPHPYEGYKKDLAVAVKMIEEFNK